MIRRLGLIAALFISSTAMGAEPSWSGDTLAGYFRRSEAAQALAGPAQLDELANIAGSAYSIPRSPGEDPVGYARRVLKTVDPAHPNVAGGDWVMALVARFYKDAGDRGERLSRLTKDRELRVYLDRKSAQAKAAAAQISANLLYQVDGVEGAMAPLPVADAEPLTTWGAAIAVTPAELVVEGLSRAAMVNGTVSPDAPRTTNGVLREVKAALDFFERTAATMGMIDPMKKKGKGIARVFAPGQSTAAVLNEIVKAANEAKMTTVILMATNKAGVLNQVVVPLNKAPTKKKSPPVTDVKCKAEVTIQACVDWIIEKKGSGPIRFLAQ